MHHFSLAFLTHNHLLVQTTLNSQISLLAVAVLFVLLLSIAASIMLRHLGVGCVSEQDEFKFKAAPSTLVHTVLLVCYAALALGIIDSAVNHAWSTKAYILTIVASLLSVCWGGVAAMESRLGRTRNGDYQAGQWFIFEIVFVEGMRLLLLAVHFAVLYSLWWSIYIPFRNHSDYRYVQLVVSNGIAFYTGWTLFVAIRWLAIFRICSDAEKSRATTAAIVVATLLAFAAVALVVQLKTGEMVVSFGGFAVAGAVGIIGFLTMGSS